MTPSLDHVRDLFRSRDLRCTRQRELVYTALAASREHPTAEELYRAVHEADPGLSLATVYNTLEALLERGLGRRIGGDGNGPCRYDAEMEPHIHVMVGDGRPMDVPQDLSRRMLAGMSPELIREIEERMSVKISGVSVQLTGEGLPGTIQAGMA